MAASADGTLGSSWSSDGGSCVCSCSSACSGSSAVPRVFLGAVRLSLAAEIGGQHLRVADQLACASGVRDHAVPQHVRLVRRPRRPRPRSARPAGSSARAAQRQDRAIRSSTTPGREADRRLVHQEQRGRAISARPIASCVCSPPLRAPASIGAAPSSTENRSNMSSRSARIARLVPARGRPELEIVEDGHVREHFAALAGPGRRRDAPCGRPARACVARRSGSGPRAGRSSRSAC